MADFLGTPAIVLHQGAAISKSPPQTRLSRGLPSLTLSRAFRKRLLQNRGIALEFAQPMRRPLPQNGQLKNTFREPCLLIGVVMPHFGHSTVSTSLQRPLNSGCPGETSFVLNSFTVIPRNTRYPRGLAPNRLSFWSGGLPTPNPPYFICAHLPSSRVARRETNRRRRAA
jgi:hypothetical protein